MENSIFEALYKEYFPMVFLRCKQLLKNHEEAENAANDVFVKFLSLEERDFPKSYLYSMATNRGLNRLKKRKRGIQILYAEATNVCKKHVINKNEGEIWEHFNTNAKKQTNDIGNQHNERSYEQIDVKLSVEAVLRTEDKKTRDIYNEYYYKDKTLEEIGEVIGLSKSAVHKRLMKINEQLRLKL
ncbi:MAG: sigma-70 family RNA polymerase sigma factor [Treponema sp.]|nr:sigma-70 family RNA polymerase sigma factor [Treponema sp.]